LNQEYENYFYEEENLFGIIKCNQFRKRIPIDEGKELKQIIQFLLVTLIHVNILQRNRNTSLPWKIIKIKNEAFGAIKPFIEQV